MKVVIVESKEAPGQRLAVLVSESDLWPLQVLCARAGQKVLAVKEEKDAS